MPANYQSDDDSIRTSNRANNETYSLQSSASSHYLLNVTSKKLLGSLNGLSFDEDSVEMENSGNDTGRKSAVSSRDIQPV